MTTKKTTAAKAAKATKKKTAPKKRAHRADKVRTFLDKAKGPKTVREITEAIGEPQENAKYVSSLLIGWEIGEEPEVKSVKAECPITHRSVWAYSLVRGKSVKKTKHAA